MSITVKKLEIAKSNTVDLFLSWLAANRTMFLVNFEKGLPDSEASIKAFGEMVIVAGILKDFGIAPSITKAIAEESWKAIDAGQYLEEALATQSGLWVATELYPSFLRLGYRHLGTDEVFRKLSSSINALLVLQPDWRKLSVYYALKSVGIINFRTAFTAHTWLSQQPPAWLLTEESAYAVTHEVFYITNFGRSPNSLDRSSIEYLSMWLPVWLDEFYNKGNIDVTAELVLTARFANIPIDLTFYIEQICDAQEVDGVVPPKRNRFQKQFSSESQRFLAYYHSTLVSLLAVTSCLVDDTSKFG